jgi:hypothetical protein
MTPEVIAPRSISVATNRKAEEVVADAAIVPAHPPA